MLGVRKEVGSEIQTEILLLNHAINHNEITDNWQKHFEREAAMAAAVRSVFRRVHRAMT